MKNITGLLKNALADDFSRYLTEFGFFRNGEVGFYLRKRSEFYDLVEVQFDKYGKPKFVINFGMVPAGGIVDSYGRHVSLERVRIHHLVVSGRLYRFPYSIFWFHVHTIFNLRSQNASVNLEVLRLRVLFKQVLRWFESDQVGPNVSIWRHPENAPGTRQKSMKERGVWPPEDWTEEDERSLRM